MCILEGFAHRGDDLNPPIPLRHSPRAKTLIILASGPPQEPRPAGRQAPRPARDGGRGRHARTAFAGRVVDVHRGNVPMLPHAQTNAAARNVETLELSKVSPMVAGQ